MFIIVIVDIGKFGLGIRIGINNYIYEFVGIIVGVGGVNVWIKNVV